MNKRKITTPIILLAFILLALLATACSPNKAERLNNEGNEAFAQQAFQEALVDYQTAQIEEPELAEPYYNAANALYRQGQYEAALEQLNMALSYAEKETLATDSFFNLGNSAFSMQDLEAAVAAYTESLLRNPDDQDAKYNLELALQQQQQQQQEQEQQEQEQEQEQEQQEQSDQGENQEEEQQQESEQSQEGQQDQQEQGQEESEQGQEGEQDQQQEADQPQDDQEGEQQEQEGQPQPGQPGEEQEQEGQPSQVPAPGQRMTEEQAQQLLAAIAQNSQTLQERLGQIFAVPLNPPAQDW